MSARLTNSLTRCHRNPQISCLYMLPSGNPTVGGEGERSPVRSDDTDRQGGNNGSQEDTPRTEEVRQEITEVPRSPEVPGEIEISKEEAKGSPKEEDRSGAAPQQVQSLPVAKRVMSARDMVEWLNLQMLQLLLALR